MKKKTKNITKIATLATVCVLAASLGTSNIFASAANTSANGRYYTDYTSEEVAVEEAENMNKELASEGIVMLKNDGSLPISKGSTVSVLGIAQDCMVETSGSITDSLTAAGLTVNPTLLEYYSADGADYRSFGTEGELNNTQKQSLRIYNDLGVVVIARGSAGESSGRDTAIDEYDDNTYLGEDTGWEHEAHSNDGNGNEYKHELQLTDSEQELIALAEQYCKKVVVLYSASYTFECADLQEDDNINAIYWIGRLGDGGVDAVGEILTGEINPSGKTVDEWTRDFTNDPTYVNDQTSTYTYNGSNSSYSGVDYEEDIYLGYKYYETYWYEASQGNASAKISGTGVTADEWYDYNVVYPFGYGLSYTDFSFELVSLTDNNGNAIGDTVSASDLSSSVSTGEAKITSISAEVKVTNIGEYAGKETVQVYITAPYTNGGTEKSYLTLAGYVKTDEIKAGHSQTVTVEFNVQDFASYDYSDANNDDHTGYELDAGEYTIHIMNSSSHTNVGTDAYDSHTFTLSGTAHLDLDDYSGNEVSNLFSEENGDYYSMAVSDSIGSMTLLSRSDFDGTKTTAPTSDQLVLSASDIEAFQKYEYIDAEYIDDSQYAWYKTDDDIPDTWTQGAGVIGSDGQYSITLDDMAGKELYDSNGNVNTAWTTFMNQLTWSEIASVVNNGYHVTAAVSTIGKLESTDENGPNYTLNLTTWVGEPTVAATWNTELCERYGMMVGNIALFQGMTGWYGPGTNTHRNQFNGRNPEYYSQDNLQGGYIAAAVVKGATATGINVYVKHFALYDTSAGNYGATNLSEQNLRENYLKIFQMCFQEGGATATMTAFNRIGYNYVGTNYNLMQKLARDEWGWTGFSVTDISIATATIDGLVRAGAELPDGNWNTTTYTNSATGNSGYKGLSGEWDAENNCVLVNGEASATQWYCGRMAAMRVLYNCANSAANFNGVTDTELSYTFTATQGVEFSQSVVPEQYSDPDAGYVIGYVVTSGELPTGLTIDESGTLTGTPTSAGTYNVTIELKVDYWVTIELNLILEVESNISMEHDISSLNTGDSVDSYILFDKTITTAEYGDLEFSLYSGSLPTGLTLDEDGLISGTATTAGTYTFTVLISAVNGTRYTVNPDYASWITYLSSQAGSSNYDDIAEYLKTYMSNYLYVFLKDNPLIDFYYTYTITVAGDEGATETLTVEDVTLNASGNLVVTYSDGTTSEIEITSSTGSVTDYVSNVAVNSDGDIVVTFADGTSTTIEIATESGKYVSGVASNGDGTITITYTDSTSETVTVTSEDGSGCSGSITANIVTIVAMLTIACAAVIVVRKKRAEK